MGRSRIPSEVLDNLGVFGLHPEDVIAPCPPGFRRVPINEGGDSYLSLQGFAPNQIAYAHPHPDSEEWVVVLRGAGQALLSEEPVPLSAGLIIGRAAAHPHGFKRRTVPPAVPPATETGRGRDHLATACRGRRPGAPADLGPTEATTRAIR